ncbi:MAG TPA: baseplate J/gp47 family protein, partial [Thermoleophilia bacterium]|nr:baseplate J/gp47 family protein [Thermoleophilia bacterium]
MTDVISAPDCRIDERRESLLESAALPAPTGLLNGIDYVEVDPLDHTILRVTFLKPLPAGAYGIPADLRRISIVGGTRIVGIRPLAATAESTSVLRIDVDRGGDYSPYTLTLDADDLDPVKRSTVFSFMASCPTDADCLPAPCPPVVRDEPLLDYLAKDYASLRRLLLDLLPTLNPDWVERSPADLGIALVELLAYTGDRLSYQQDAVIGEAYLETVRHRISARRHARLIDYRMHDGRNAWTALVLHVTATGTIARGTPVMTVLPRDYDPLDITVELLDRDPKLRDVVVFETAHDAQLRAVNNTLRVHMWGDEECCLPAGATEAYLYAVPATTAQRPVLEAGGHLVFEEVRGPRTGNAADADPAHRVLVRLEKVDNTATDPLYARTVLADGALQLRGPGDQPLPLTRVRWRRADALAEPLCLSARVGDDLVRNVSVARGNVILADHGLTRTEPHPVTDLGVDGRLVVTYGPLTMEQRPALPPVSLTTGRFEVDRDELSGDARDALPALTLLVTDAAATVHDWTSVPDLLDSGAFDEQFVAEVDDEGRAELRFGDGEYGRELPADAAGLTVVYRVGNGRAGNVGHDTLTTIALAGAPGFVTGLRNPLAATGGVDAETVEQVRRRAPEAMRAVLKRAVTEADWVRAAEQLDGVSGAVATFRWTGTWLTIFVAVDPVDRADLVDLPNGRTRLEASFERRVRAWLTRFRIAGHDIELRPPRFVGLELAVEVCAKHGYFRTDVQGAVRDALSARVLPDGTRGFFHPDRFTFGDDVYLS